MFEVEKNNVSLKVKKRYVAFIALVVLLPWVILIWVVKSYVIVLNPASKHYVSTGSETNNFHCKAGPWGELEYLRINLEPPEELNPAWRDVPKQIEWRLHDFTEGSFHKLLQDCGFSDDQIKESIRCLTPDPSIHGFLIKPSDKLLYGLNASQRSAFYEVLSRTIDNPGQYFPTKVYHETFNECRKKAHLSDSQFNLLQSLIYTKSEKFIFFDVDAFLRKLDLKEQRKAVWSCIMQQPTLLVRMKITSSMDIDSIARYWGKEGYDKDVKPVLNAIAEHPTESYLSIQYLLPPFARVRLFTYPMPSDQKTDSSHDCVWTALNFFEDSDGKDEFAKTEVAQKRFLNDYYPIVDEPTLGDIAVLTKTSGEFVHMAVFIADNIYFTKNGPSLYSPWVLVELPDILDQYSIHGPVVLKYYRLKRVDS